MPRERFDPYRIPEIGRWRWQDGSRIELQDFVRIHVSAVEAIAFAGVLTPEFVSIRGCTLLAEQFNAAYFEDWWTSLNGDIQAIEAVINHLHLWDLFTDEVPEDEGEIITEGLAWLAEVMATCWRAALADAFPEKRFVFDVSNEPNDGPVITFWTASDED